MSLVHDVVLRNGIVIKSKPHPFIPDWRVFHQKNGLSSVLTDFVLHRRINHSHRKHAVVAERQAVSPKVLHLSAPGMSLVVPSPVQGRIDDLLMEIPHGQRGLRQLMVLVHGKSFFSRGQ